ncbi:MAG: ABC transporter ATP-binding protein [Eubacteriales bacterium]
MKDLLKYLKDYKKETVLGPLFKLLEATFELFVPLVVAAIVNVGIKNQDTGFIVTRCLILLALGLIGLGFSVTAQYFSAKAAIGFGTKVRHALFDKIQSFTFSAMDRIGSSTLITRMTSDVNQVQSGVNMTLRLFLRSPFIVFGAMIMAFTIDVRSALIFAVTIPALSVVVFGILLITIPLYKKTQNRLDTVLSTTRENLTGVRVLRAFCKEDSEKKRFDQANGELNRAQRRVGWISGLMNPLTYVLINLAIIWLIQVGGARVQSGDLEQGDVIALYNYLSQILVELIKLANLIITITKALACANRVADVLKTDEQDDKLEPVEHPDDPFITFRNVGLTYRGAGGKALEGISFTANRGETVGIIGGTGSGKSSLVHLLSHFYDATEGEVIIDGLDVKAYDPEVLRQKVGIVMQKATLFKGTIRSNLEWGNPNATDDEMWQALELAQAKEVALAKGGLDAEVAQAGRNFSGGQKQRLTIARALVRHPEILILDDSASALDYATDAALRKAIRTIPEKPTVFLVSQRTSTLMHADRIIVLDDGKTVGIGTHSQLLESCPVYQEIYYSQYPDEKQKTHSDIG